MGAKAQGEIRGHPGEGDRPRHGLSEHHGRDERARPDGYGPSRPGHLVRDERRFEGPRLVPQCHLEETGFGKPRVELRVVGGGRDKLHGALVSRVAFEQRVRRFENLFLLFVWSEIHLLLPVRYTRGSPSMRVAT